MATILIVDDEEIHARALGRFLAGRGHTCEVATSATGALESMRAVRPHLVLLDLRLGEVDGLETLRELKALDPGLPVIMMTAYGSVETAVRAMKEGALDYVQKPMDLEELELALEPALAPVPLDRNKMEQVFSAVLANAMDASPAGATIRVSSALRQPNHVPFACIRVEDAGPGIPDAERQRIFDRFTQLERHRQRRAGGVGLGLYIARQLARSQDGDLLVTDPANGHGARFELHLPLVPDATGS